MNRVPVMCGAVACLLVLGGCERGDRPETVRLTAADNGTTVSVGIGGVLLVSLEENITTGYEWETETVDGAILRYAGERYRQDRGCGGRVGCGGTVAISYDAVGVGQTVLRLVYRQSEEMGFAADGPPSAIFEVTVRVDP